MSQIVDKMLVNYFPGSIMTVLQEETKNCTTDMTLQYVLLLLTKVVLNTLVLSFELRTIPKTLLGVFSISIYLVDLLLICSISWAWWFYQDHQMHELVCSSLSHGSIVYSLLPLPVLLAGALDYVIQQYVGFGQKSLCRTVVHCAVVALMWMLACFYSYSYTEPELLTIQYNEEVTALVCSVQRSLVVSHFCLHVFIIVGFVLLLHWRKLPRWVLRANQLSEQRTGTLSMSDLAFSKKLEKLESGVLEEAYIDNQQDRPSIMISLVLCFALNWTPYLLMNMVCDLLGFALPANVSVNLLFASCANSLLMGVAFWYRSNKYGPICTMPDDISAWSVFWYLSKENGQFTASTKLYEGLG